MHVVGCEGAGPNWHCPADADERSRRRRDGRNKEEKGLPEQVHFNTAATNASTHVTRKTRSRRVHHVHTRPLRRVERAECEIVPTPLGVKASSPVSSSFLQTPHRRRRRPQRERLPHSVVISMQTRSQRSTVLGKRDAPSEPSSPSATCDSTDAGQLLTPGPSPNPKRMRTSATLCDGDWNKENIPPLRIEALNASPSTRAMRSLRRTSTISEAHSTPRAGRCEPYALLTFYFAFSLCSSSSQV